MVFVWSTLTKGNPAYTVVQVATNDLIILVAFVPIVKLLLGVSNVQVPMTTLFLSVVLFVVIPLALGILTRVIVTKSKGADYFENTFIHKFDGITTIGLLLTLILIFSFQGNVILENCFFSIIGYRETMRGEKQSEWEWEQIESSGMIGASNFFELAVAVAVALFGTSSPAALATTVGVLTEVPVMLLLCRIANNTKKLFDNSVS